MSDDHVLGDSFGCIPRRIFAVMASLVLATYGLISCCYLVLWEWLPGGMQEEVRCRGHRCEDVLSCPGMQEASYHTVTVCRVIGCLVFGSWGFFGAVHGHVSELRYLAMFLWGMAAVLIAAAAMDGLYIAACGTYPYNVISEALLWMTPGLPVSDILKRKILHEETFNVRYLNALTLRNVWHSYLLIEIPFVALWCYAAHEVAMMARLHAFGTVGLGANFSIRSWREEVILKNQLRDDLVKAQRLARQTASDIAYQPPAGGAGQGLGGFLYKQDYGSAA